MPAAPWNRSDLSVSDAETISPLASTISIRLIVLSKKPYLKELLSPPVPANPPPTVMPGNSMTTGGTRPNFKVALTRSSMGTFGSSMAVLVSISTSNTWDRSLVSIILLRLKLEGRVLLVEP